ncbi:MAG: carbohydrate ABC transporter permease [Clostridia bacterium]|nr:carbohydrate ABC transporter permease [Clostridia bacterium]
MKREFKRRRRPWSVERAKNTGKWFFVYAAVIALLCFMIMPLVYLICTAFKPLHEMYVFPPQFFVRNPTIKNFNDLLMAMSSSAVPFTRYIFNSVYVTIVTVVGTVFVSTLGAYGMSKHNPPGSKFFFQVIVAALMISPYVTQIPRYLIISGLGLVNHYSALIIPALATAYYFFLVKQFVDQIPNELLEAARVDGCGEMRIYWKIVMPSLTPAWATMMVFCFVASWNDAFSPMIYLTDQAMKTLPVALNTISGGTASLGRAGATAAATLLMTMPTIILFSACQNMVTQTMVHSGIKG